MISSTIVLAFLAVVAVSESAATTLYPFVHPSLLAKLPFSSIKRARRAIARKEHGTDNASEGADAVDNTGSVTTEPEVKTASALEEVKPSLNSSETMNTDEQIDSQVEAVSVREIEDKGPAEVQALIFEENTDSEDPFADPVEIETESIEDNSSTTSFIRIVNIDCFPPNSKRSFFNRQWEPTPATPQPKPEWTVTEEYNVSDLTEEQRAEAKAYSDSLHEAGRALYHSYVEMEAERRANGIAAPAHAECASHIRQSELRQLGRSSMLTMGSITATDLELEADEDAEEVEEDMSEEESSDDEEEIVTPTTTPNGSEIVIWDEDEENELEPLEDLLSYFSKS